MARKANSISEIRFPLQVHTCGECSVAFGFCLKGADGLPICCRCGHDDTYLRMCSSPACDAFDPSGKPLPVDFMFGVSPRRNEEAL